MKTVRVTLSDNQYTKWRRATSKGDSVRLLISFNAMSGNFALNISDTDAKKFEKNKSKKMGVTVEALPTQAGGALPDWTKKIIIDAGKDVVNKLKPHAKEEYLKRRKKILGFGVNMDRKPTIVDLGDGKVSIVDDGITRLKGNGKTRVKVNRLTPSKPHLKPRIIPNDPRCYPTGGTIRGSELVDQAAKYARKIPPKTRSKYLVGGTFRRPGEDHNGGGNLKSKLARKPRKKLTPEQYKKACANLAKARLAKKKK